MIRPIISTISHLAIFIFNYNMYSISTGAVCGFFYSSGISFCTTLSCGLFFLLFQASSLFPFSPNISLFHTVGWRAHQGKHMRWGSIRESKHQRGIHGTAWIWEYSINEVMTFFCGGTGWDAEVSGGWGRGKAYRSTAHRGGGGQTRLMQGREEREGKGAGYMLGTGRMGFGKDGRTRAHVARGGDVSPPPGGGSYHTDTRTLPWFLAYEFTLFFFFFLPSCGQRPLFSFFFCSA